MRENPVTSTHPGFVLTIQFTTNIWRGFPRLGWGGESKFLPDRFIGRDRS